MYTRSKTPIVGVKYREGVIGRQTMRHAWHPVSEESETAATGAGSPWLPHDFSRMLVHPASAGIDGPAHSGQKMPLAGARGQPQPKVPPPAPQPAPTAPPAPAPAAPKPQPPKLSIAHETKFAAPGVWARTRTEIGVGEKVAFTGSAAGNWTATGGVPWVLADAATLDWTAPSRGADVTVKLVAGGEEASVVLKVIEPSPVITGTRTGKIPIPAGTAGAGMYLVLDYHPKTVSFGNVQAKEVSGDATNIHGYYKKHYSKEELHHSAGDYFTSIKENNDDNSADQAKTEDEFKPYEKGGYDWVIPNHFRVKTETGDGKKFAEVTQAFRMIDSTGRVKITKAGAEVERSPGEG
jgi:hypothetical protein